MALLLAGVMAARAVPAYPRPVTVVQPDGSTVVIRLHGDENFHWITNELGEYMERDGQGFLQKVSKAEIDARAAAAPYRGSMRRSSEPQHSSSISLGEKRFLVVLIEFSDLSFKKSRQDFYNLTNQVGYNGTGSVYDYYAFQSQGKLQPVWDVFGPVKASGKLADYGGNDSSGSDKNPDGLLAEALRALDGQVNFKQYDNDGDGYVDNVFFFYAGYSEAEGASSDTIWPHEWTLRANYSNMVLDGVRFDSYSCSSELTGTKGSNISGIGSCCHEFGHALGLPDFYDTNYYTNGLAEYTPDTFSVMDSGCYNNNSQTPPNMSAMERYILEWMDEPQTLSEPGSYSLETITSNKAYMLLSDVKNEYFIFETRDGAGWDRYINQYAPSTPVQGLVVYQVDQSSNKVSGSIKAYSLWNYNKINAYSVHPCYRIIPAKDSYRHDRWVYPYGNITEYIPEPWSEKDLNVWLTDITYSNGITTFTLAGPESSGTGIKIIKSPKMFYSVGNVFTFSLSTDGDAATSVKWYFDGSRTTDPSVTLTSKGAHTVKAIVGYADSSTEEIERVIIVQ